VKKKKINLNLKPFEFGFFKVAKNDISGEETLQFIFNNGKANAYVVKSSDSDLPSPGNTLKTVSFEGGEDKLSFSPKAELNNFQEGEYEYLYFGKKSIF